MALFADRTSTALMRSNQLRLYFSSITYCLLQSLRRLALKGTEMAQAQCGIIRLRLLKIGAQIRVSVRKVWIMGAPDIYTFPWCLWVSRWQLNTTQESHGLQRRLTSMRDAG
jgi:hypothetical protein